MLSYQDATVQERQVLLCPGGRLTKDPRRNLERVLALVCAASRKNIADRLPERALRYASVAAGTAKAKTVSAISRSGSSLRVRT